MHQRAQPNLDSMRAPELLLTYQAMQATVVVTNVASQMFPQHIFLDPVDFKVAKGLAIPAADARKAVSTRQAVAEEFFLVRDRPILTPEM